MGCILFATSLVFGAVWGAWRGRRDRFSFGVLMLAPVFSGILNILIFAALMVVDILIGDTPGGGPPGWRPINPAKPLESVLIWLATAVVLGCFVGAVPALVGSAVSQSVKLQVGRRDSGS